MTIEYLGQVEPASGFDIGIIGSGPAGMTLAIELAEAGASIALFEAGRLEFDPLIQAEYDMPLFDEGFNLAPLSASRLRMFGGTSNHWGGWCTTLLPQEFDSSLGDMGLRWPITYEELQLWHTKACDTLDLGRNAFLFSDYPTELEDESLNGAGLQELVRAFRFSPATNFSQKYAYALSSASPKVFLESPVIDFVMSDSGVKGVVVAPRNGGRKFEILCKQIVIAAGGIESTVLLQKLDRTYGVLDPSARSFLGRGIGEHPHFVNSLVYPLGKNLGRNFSHRVDSDGVDYRFFLASFKDDAPSISVTLEMVTADGDQLIQRNPALSAVHQLSTHSSLEGFHGFFRTEMPSFERNRISLTEQGYEVHIEASSTRKLLTESMVHLFESIADLGFAIVESDWTSFEEPFWGGNHHLGGTAMGCDSSCGVVSPDLAVFGTGNLFVLSSSTFPRHGFANPTFSIVALAHRLAAHLVRT